MTHDPRISRIWSMVRPFLGETLKKRLIVVRSDAELVEAVGDVVGSHSLPLPLRRRSLRALLESRPARSQLLARGLLQLPPAAEGSPPADDGGADGAQSDAQQQAVALALLQERLPTVCDRELLRYLRGCKWQVTRAERMLVETHEWRHAHRLDGILDEPLPDGSSGELLRASFCHHGADSSGAPLFVFRPAYLQLDAIQRRLSPEQAHSGHAAVTRRSRGGHAAVARRPHAHA